jgi:hypothetical protein
MCEFEGIYKARKLEKRFCYRHVIGGIDTTSILTFFPEVFIHARRWTAISPTLEKLLHDIKNGVFKSTMINEYIRNLNGSYIGKVGKMSLFKLDVYYTLCKYFNIKSNRIYIAGNGPKDWVEKNAFLIYKDEDFGCYYAKVDEWSLTDDTDPWAIETWMCMMNRENPKHISKGVKGEGTSPQN